MNNAVLTLAQKFFQATQKKLYVNDMSLPWGGVLDFTDNWTKPHAAHRFGTDVDINRTLMSSAERTTFLTLAKQIFGQQNVCVHGGTNGHWHLSWGHTCKDIPLEAFLRGEE